MKIQEPSETQPKKNNNAGCIIFLALLMVGLIYAGSQRPRTTQRGSSSTSTSSSVSDDDFYAVCGDGMPRSKFDEISKSENFSEWRSYSLEDRLKFSMLGLHVKGVDVCSYDKKTLMGCIEDSWDILPDVNASTVVTTCSIDIKNGLYE